ncbi:biotin transporter BioY [Methylovirgula sp. 4M-Z18]|uniref:biotin transporter BioY n=1 Tax=Methylovirgula sp. 4M-Z18 TaxID=2293567 RepID=UPI000E2F38B8|nr:biotin transporter BioY [Methylovirgula sp. 4M-Z18]RFB78405.1 biotin transporter BioY [Methylovirgula sp. 4M-Z18]
MRNATTPFVPFSLAGSDLARKSVAVLIGVAALTLASKIQVPMLPVPMTMQTFAVVMVGALCGARLGLVTVLAWLALTLLGVPLIAEWVAGPAPFVGPTAGYLASFPLMAVLMGWLAERGWTNNLVLSGLAMVLANVVCFVLGWAWLATLIGADKALAFGVTPFLLGSVVKCALGVALVEALRRNVKSA